MGHYLHVPFFPLRNDSVQHTIRLTWCTRVIKRNIAKNGTSGWKVKFGTHKINVTPVKIIYKICKLGKMVYAINWYTVHTRHPYHLKYRERVCGKCWQPEHFCLRCNLNIITSIFHTCAPLRDGIGILYILFPTHINGTVYLRIA